MLCSKFFIYFGSQHVNKMLATKSTIFQRFANLPLNDALCEPISFSLCMSARSAVSKVLVSQALSGLPWLTLAHFYLWLTLSLSLLLISAHCGSLWLDKPARLTIVPICQIRYKRKQIVGQWHYLTLTHFGSLWLCPAHSGSLWLALTLTLAL